MAKILCDKCHKEIRYREDLVVTTYVLPIFLRKYHNTCYAQREKTLGGFFLVGGKPINTPVFTAIAVIFSVMFIGLFSLSVFLGQNSPLILLVAVAALVLLFFVPRTMSYYKYEKALPSRK